MNKIYKEEKLSHNFASSLVVQIDKIIDSGRSMNLVSSPGVGSSLFFKYLITHSNYKFIYIDCDHFVEASVEEFYRMFLNAIESEIENFDKRIFVQTAQKQIEKLLQTNEHLVIILGHFEVMKGHFDKDFFDQLQFLRSLSSNRISFIINSTRPMVELLADKLGSINTNIIGQTIYLTPYSRSDIQEIAKLLMGLDIKDEWINKSIHLSGGSFYLFNLLTRTEKIHQPLSDPFIKMYFKQLVESLTNKRKKQLTKIALDKINELAIDEYLLNIGIIQKTSNSDFKLFTPLLRDYLAQNTSLKLSSGERKLFATLKEKLGKVVMKDDLFNEVWGQDNDASDWALNSMIYRIRNNPVFKEQGYEIENYKKIGYKLVKNS